MKEVKQTILVAEDDEKIRQMLVLFLKANRFDVLEACNGREALDLFYGNNSLIDLILLDVMMPELDGFAVLHQIRQDSMVPIVMLTAKDEEYDQLNGLKSGADDYISKPFSPSILLARLETVLRRVSATPQSEAIVAGNLEVFCQSRTVKHNGKVMNLTPKEYDFLLYLITNKEIVLSREQILNAVWNYDYTGDPRTVDTHVKQLRYKLGNDSACIRTVHGMGYIFEAAG